MNDGATLESPRVLYTPAGSLSSPAGASLVPGETSLEAEGVAIGGGGRLTRRVDQLWAGMGCLNTSGGVASPVARSHPRGTDGKPFLGWQICQHRSVRSWSWVLGAYPTPTCRGISEGSAAVGMSEYEMQDSCNNGTCCSKFGRALSTGE